jgi:hypothetical protein
MTVGRQRAFAAAKQQQQSSQQVRLWNVWVTGGDSAAAALGMQSATQHAADATIASTQV